MTTDDVLARLRADGEFMRDVTEWRRAPATPARFDAYPAHLDPRLVHALHSRGIDRPYVHQTEAIDAAMRGEHVVVAAGTAGGKSLCFQAPIANALLTDPNTRALCLFPTKALAQDQVEGFDRLTAELGLGGQAKGQKSRVVATYDGDTPQPQRAEIRRDARVVITNADMLHLGILPHHTRWAAFFRNLRYVVIDELHSYRGIFGSHVANVIRRLSRLCAFYGSRPSFILASATIANPREHAERLIEAPVALVDDDGSPRGERNVVIVNPPITDPMLGLRRSADFVARDVAARLIGDGLQTICFARSRNAAEILLTYLQDQAGRFTTRAGDSAGARSTGRAGARDTIRGYRGGYLPEERREIERGLRAGAVRGVVSTNALELGIDIGALDACVMLGYPGSVASFWQQAGRAGRRQGASLAVMVATADPLDQYLAMHPDFLFQQSPEHARVAPNNLGVLAAHVACAAFELPFGRGERFGRAAIDDLLDALADDGALHASAPEALPLLRGAEGHAEAENPLSSVRYTWIGDGYPADRISLRGAGDRVSIMSELGDLIGETERSTAAARVHPGAIYLHQGEAYLITELDWDLGRAVARRAHSDYYTQPSAVSEVVVLREFGGMDPGAVRQPRSGEIEVTTTVGRFRQIQFNTHRTLGWGEVDLPAQHLLTVGYWISLDAELAKRLAKEGVIGLPNDYGPNWARQRDAARERDDYRCTVCGRPEPAGAQHHVHHRQPFRSFGYVPGENENYLRANDLDNLLTVCPTCHARVETAETVNHAMIGLCYLLGNLAPLFVMCDAADIAATFDMTSAHTRLPTITVYEMAPGGTGLTDELIVHHAALLAMAAQRIRECGCERGCPACIGPIDDTLSRDVKRDVARLIDALTRGS